MMIQNDYNQGHTVKNAKWAQPMLAEESCSSSSYTDQPAPPTHQHKGQEFKINVVEYSWVKKCTSHLMVKTINQLKNDNN